MNPTTLASVIAVLLPTAALAEDAPPPVEAVSEPSPQWSTMATAREEYRARLSRLPVESDQTARLTLDAEGHSPTDEFSVRGSLGLWWRFDENYATPTALASPRDSLWLDVYQLSADWRPHRLLELVRAGRQDAEFGNPATFDGLTAIVKPAPWLRFFAFGGRSEHFFSVNEGSSRTGSPRPASSCATIASSCKPTTGCWPRTCPPPPP